MGNAHLHFQSRKHAAANPKGRPVARTTHPFSNKRKLLARTKQKIRTGTHTRVTCLPHSGLENGPHTCSTDSCVNRLWIVEAAQLSGLCYMPKRLSQHGGSTATVQYHHLIFPLCVMLFPRVGYTRLSASWRARPWAHGKNGWHP